MLFEVAILKSATKKELDEGAQELLLWGPTALVAANAEAAKLAAVRKAGDAIKEVPDAKLQILVRPFA